MNEDWDTYLKDLVKNTMGVPREYVDYPSRITDDNTSSTYAEIYQKQLNEYINTMAIQPNPCDEIYLENGIDTEQRKFLKWVVSNVGSLTNQATVKLRSILINGNYYDSDRPMLNNMIDRYSSSYKSSKNKSK